MKRVLFLTILILLLGLAMATPACAVSTDCPPYRQCVMEGSSEICEYTNPCVCAFGLMYNIVDSDLCSIFSIAGLTCTSTPCALGGQCQYDTNV